MKKDTTKSAEQIVFEKVKSALYKRRLAPGTALTEQSLCDALGRKNSCPKRPETVGTGWICRNRSQ